MKNIKSIISIILFPLLLQAQQTTTIQYQYDDLGRLTKVSYADGTTEEYCYDEVGNQTCYIINATTTGQPDLTITSASSTSNIVGVGGPVTVNCQNSNNGALDANGHYVKIFYSDDNQYQNTDIPLDINYFNGLTANNSVSQTKTVTIPNTANTGSRYLIIYTDETKIITESDENNNIYVIPITINGCSPFNFSYNTTDETCQNQNGSITATVTGTTGTTTYQWNTFPIQTTSTANNLSAGNYQVTVTDGLGCISVGTTSITNVGDHPSAGFTLVANGLSVQFTDNSAYPTSYSWDFGDGNTSTLPNPSHTFVTIGVYNVCLTITNTCGSDTYCQSITINNTTTPVTTPTIGTFTNTSISINYPTTIDGSTVSASTLRIWGEETGFRVGSYSINGGTITFTPTVPFRAGELLDITSTDQLQDINGTSIPFYVWKENAPVFNPTDAYFDTLYTGIQLASSYAQNSTQLSTVDFDRNGYLDIVVRNHSAYGNPTRLAIMLQNTDGTFQTPVYYSVGQSHSGLNGTPDVNNDGYPDIVVSHNVPSRLSVWINNGDGTFPPSSVNYTQSNYSSGSSYADIDNDGDLDLIATCGISSLSNNRVSIFKNNGNGTFQSQITVPLSGGLGGGRIPADMDNDGDMDLITMTTDKYGGTPTLLIYENINGALSLSLNEANPNVASPLTVQDFDNDGNKDIVVHKPTISIRKGNGDLTINSSTSIHSNIATALSNDLNGNGMMDLFARYASNGTSQINHQVYINDGSVNFTIDTGLVAPYRHSLKLGDIDNDGDVDYVYMQADGKIYILENKNVPCTLPIADFSTIINDSIITTVNNSISGATYYWDFGDGNTATGYEPNHTYSSSGTYDITLIVDNLCGSDTVVQQVTVIEPCSTPCFACKDNSLIVHYKFDQTTDDETNNQYHSLNSNISFTTNKEQVVNKAGEFDAYLETIQLPNAVLDNQGDFTVSVWIKTNQSGVAVVSGAKDNIGHNEFVFYINTNGTLLPHIKNSYSSGQTVVNDNQWHHIIVTRNGSTGLLSTYVDGILDAHHNLPTGNLDINALYLGNDQDCLNGCWDINQQFIGKIDELRFFSKILNANDIQELYTEGYPANNVVCVDQFTCNLNQVGIDTIWTINALGCDSVTIVNTILLPSDTTYINTTTCDVAQVGTSSVILQNQEGCDSLIITNTILSINNNIVNNGLTAHYSVDNNLNDISGNNQHAISGNSSYDTSWNGLVNGAVLFDNYLETIRLPNTIVNTQGDISVSLWIKTNQAGGVPFSGAKSNTIHNEFALFINNSGYLSPHVKNAATVGQIYVTDNQWHHIIMTMNSATGLVQTFVDGVFDANHNFPSGNIGVNALYLGNDQDCLNGCWQSTNQFLGKMDEIRFYNRILTNAEIQQLYNQGSNITATNLDMTTCDPLQVGVDTLVLTTTQGCDSLVITTTTLLPSDTTYLSATTCDTSQAGITSILLQNQHGCDSLVVTTTTLLPTSTTLLTETICANESYTVGTQTFSQTGIYIVTLFAVNGCDSIVTLDLRVLSTFTTSVTKTICANENYTVGTQAFNQTGVYTVTLSTLNGCDSVVTLSLTVLPTFTTSIAETICANESYTVGSQTFSQTGVYTVNLTTSNGCDSVITLNLTVLPTFTTSITETICANESYAIGAQTFNQTGIYTVTLSAVNGCDSVITLDLMILPIDTTFVTEIVCSPSNAGVFTSVLSGIDGCDSVVITTKNHHPIFTTISSTNVSCFSGNDGSATIVVSGGTLPYTYLWGNGDNTTTITGLSSGIYAVTITDGAGCATTKSITVNEPQAALKAQIISTTNYNGLPVTCADSQDGSLWANVSGGTAPYMFAWSNSINSQSNTNLGIGTYVVTVTDNNGCVAIDTFQLHAQPIVVTDTVVHITCSGNATGEIIVSAQGGAGPYTYNWQHSATGNHLVNLYAGLYIVSVTDINGCVVVDSIIVTEQLPLIINSTKQDLVCYDDSTGQITLQPTGGWGGYNYIWSTGDTTATINNLPAGIYTITVSDGLGCQNFATIQIFSPSGIVAQPIVAPVSCFGESDGSITLQTIGGIGNYTYTWSNGATTSSLTGLAGGTYTVSITDGSGCLVIENIVVQEPAAINSNAIVQPSSCHGDNTTSIQLNPTGGNAVNYTYQWSTGQTTSSIDSLADGNYIVTITDDSSCQAIDIFIIASPSSISVTAQLSPPTCFNSNNGYIDLTISGGTGDYYIVWNTGNISEDLVNVGAGVYSVSIFDSLGCAYLDTFDLNIATPLSIVLSTQQASCANSDGSIIATVTGGLQPYSYAWSNGANSAIVNNLPTGIYTVTVTGANGCSLFLSDTIHASNPISVISNIMHPSCDSSSDGQLDITVFNAVTPVSYTWSSGAITQDLNNVGAGIYTVNIVDAVGCTYSFTDTLFAPPPLYLSMSNLSNACNGNHGSVSIVASGGIPPYAYSWSNGEITPHLTNLGAGVYTLTVLDANGCSIVSSDVTIPGNPFANISYIQLLINFIVIFQVNQQATYGILVMVIRLLNLIQFIYLVAL